MAQLTFTKPTAFTQGIVAQVLAGNVMPSDFACNVNGSGTISWLLRFDLATGTLKTGGAKPTANPAGPYTFVDEVIQTGQTQIHVQPVTFTAPLSASCTFSSSVGDMVLPAYLDASGTQVILLPMHGLRFHDGTISADLGCIGRYNAEGLDPANSCLPDDQHPSFLDGAALDANMTLEETDQIVISALNESLCVLLSGNTTMYGTKNAQNVTVCKRDANNKILYQGDWCAATDAPATNGCADAVRLSASFSARATAIQ
jgi:hypothetical protein